MRVLLDVDAIAPSLTGIGRYVLALARGLQQSQRIDKVDFFTAGRKVDNVDSLLLSDRPMASLRRCIPPTRRVRQLYRLYSDWKFRTWTHAHNYDIYHSPSYRLAPFKGKSVVTFHDLSFERHPGFHPPDRSRFWQEEVRSVVKRATHIIADSEFTRQEIVDLLGVSPTMVTTIHLGVDNQFRDYDESECLDVLSKHGLSYNAFCLVVATIEPRKNFERLLRAFEMLPTDVRRSYPLVVAGGEGWLSASNHAAIDQLAHRGELVKLGYVAEADLPKLYAAAAVFVYPSLYEGFGLPVLEAMASGTAVLSSKSSSIPEVAGDACLLVDPYSVEEISDGLRQMLDNPERRSQWAQAGLVRAREFTWQKCVDQTIDIYEKLT
jgi:glycosyltransferase involved in cell wall biosynthesis